MSKKKIGIAVAVLAASGALALGGAAIADATTSASTPSPSAGGSAGGERGGSSDTAVTGAEAAKVIAAVRAKDSAASVTTVRKDPDGSYDALGTKNGANVMYDVSTDLKTITQNSHGTPGSDDRSSTTSPSAATSSS